MRFGENIILLYFLQGEESIIIFRTCPSNLIHCQTFSHCSSIMIRKKMEEFDVVMGALVTPIVLLIT